MKPFLLVVAFVVLASCTPTEIATVTGTKPPRTTTTTVTAPTDLVLRWQCHIDGTTFTVLVNNQGKAELTPTERATCVPITPTVA